jgi:hypothetical protein
MPTNVDTSIGLLDPHPSPFSGSEVFVFVQSGQTVNGLLSELKTFIISGIPVATGDLSSTGNLTPGTYTVASGAKTVVNGLITQGATDLTAKNPNETAQLILDNNSAELYVLNTVQNRVYVDAARAGLSFFDGVSVNSFVEATATNLVISHPSWVAINGVNVQFSGLTANTVPYIDGSKYIRSSSITQTELDRLSGISSNVQTQLNSKGTVSSITAGTGLSGGVITGSGTISLANTAVTPGSYTSANITIDAQGRITSAANGSSGSSYTAGSGLTLASNQFSISAGAITDAMLASSFIKADGTIPLTDDWDAGDFRISARELVITSDGDGINISAEGTALNIEEGSFRFNDPNKGVGKTLVSNADGYLFMEYPASYPMPAMSYDTTSAGTPTKNIIVGEIPANIFITDEDKVVFEFVIGNTGGTATSLTYKIYLDANQAVSLAVPLSISADPIGIKLILKRVNETTLQVVTIWNFGAHTTTLKNMYFGNDANTYDFTQPISVAVEGNEGATTRSVSGILGFGTYNKAA